MRVVLREEKKYLITLENFIKANNYFSKVLHQDEHNGNGGYIIMSLYFDTPNNDDFYNKIDGLETRRKIRLEFRYKFWFCVSWNETKARKLSAKKIFKDNQRRCPRIN